MDYLNPTAERYFKLSELRTALEASGHFISQRRLQQMCDEGAIEATRTAGGHRRIPDYEFNRILRERGGVPSRVKPHEKRKSNVWSDGDHLKTMQRRYGVSPEEYRALCEANDWRCTICEKRPHEEYAHMHLKSQRLNLDHDHETGAARGLLCHKCNKHVAFAGDRTEIIRRVLAYVEGRLTPPVQLRFFDKSA